MSVRQDINCIFNSSIEESIKLFKEEILRISAESKKTNRNEIHNFAFCRYNDYKVITEQMYVLVYPNTILFLWSPAALALFLDKQLQIDTENSGDRGELQPEDSIIGKFQELPNIHYVGSVFNMKGELFEAFTINDTIPKKNAIRLFENDLLDIDNISPDIDDIIHVSMEFLNFQIEKFMLQIEDSVNSEDAPHPSIDENPFANLYYDHDIVQIENKKPIGKQTKIDSQDV